MSYQKVLRKDGTPEPYLFLHTRTRAYYVRKFKAGRGSLFKSTGETTLTRARLVRDELIASFEGRMGAGRRVRIAEAVEDLRGQLEKEFLAGRRRRRTWDHDRTYLPIITKLFGSFYADEIDESSWNTWALEFKGRRDLFDIAKYLSKVLTFAYARRAIPHKPRIRAPKSAERKIEIYSDADIRTFAENATPDLRDLIILAVECGLRPHENRELRWEWITFRDGVAVISLPASFTKTARGRSLEAGPNASQVLLRRFEKRSGLWVFPAPTDLRRPISDVQLSKLWRRMLKKAGLRPGPKFHFLRHTFYTRALLDAQVPVQLVSEYGGTSIVTLQKHYLRGDSRRTAVVSRAVNIDLGDKKNDS